jgi:hypothetical protein
VSDADVAAFQALAGQPPANLTSSELRSLTSMAAWMHGRAMVKVARDEPTDANATQTWEECAAALLILIERSVAELERRAKDLDPIVPRREL